MLAENVLLHFELVDTASNSMKNTSKTALQPIKQQRQSKDIYQAVNN